MKVTLGGVKESQGFNNTGRFTNPDLTSDGGLPRRVHFCVLAHKNSNHKSVCLERGLGLGKMALGIGKNGFGKGSR